MTTLKHLKQWAAAGCLAIASAGAAAATWTLTGDIVTHDPHLYKAANT